LRRIFKERAANNPEDAALLEEAATA
jgi:hypothetical protein